VYVCDAQTLKEWREDNNRDGKGEKEREKEREREKG
jgi:hypothetical protein